MERQSRSRVSRPTINASPSETVVGERPLEAGNSRVSSVIDEAIHSWSQPLDASVRAPMEATFGHDLSAVRIHAGDASTAAAKALNAEAFTTRSDLVFGASQFQPGTPAGRRLLAHELAHVVQQQHSASIGPTTVTDHGESQADVAADAVVFNPGSRPKIDALRSSGRVVQRAPAGTAAPTGKAPERPTGQLNSAEQAFLNRTVEANSTVGLAAGRFSGWLSAMTIPYAQAWNAHRAALASADVAAKDANTIVLGTVLAFVPGGIGGLVGKAMQYLDAGVPLLDFCTLLRAGQG